MKKNALLVSILLLCISCVGVVEKAQGPVVLKLEKLGSPLASYRKEAQVINTLKLFDGRLYLGYGDWSVNTGPTDVISYDLKKKEFVKEFTVDDEAIINYRVIDGKLAITGTDATESWDFGNIYVLTGKGWVKHRSIQTAVHVLDIASYKGRWFVGTGTVRPVGQGGTVGLGSVFSTADQGKTWDIEYDTPADGAMFSRVVSMAVYKDRLYAFVQTTSNTTGPVTDLFGDMDALVYDGASWRQADIIPKKKVYSTDAHVFNGKLLLVVTSMERGLANPTTSLFAYDGGVARAVGTLRFAAIGDIIVEGGRLFAVILGEDNKARIAETVDLDTWRYYELPDVAMSGARVSPYWVNLPRIEHADGVFYVGSPDGVVFRSVGTE